MSENSESQPEPGWTKSPEEELYESRPQEGPQSPSSTKSSVQSPPSQDSSGALDEIRRLRTTSSSPASSDALEGLLAEGLQLLTGLATLVTRKNLGVDVKMQASEALSAAKPIARLIARRFQIRRELSDATDGVAAGASLADYAGRILFTMPPPPQRDLRVAAPPPRTSAPLADEPRYAAPPPEAPPVQAQRPGQPPVRDQGGNAVPGSGPVKSAFLEGFD